LCTNRAAKCQPLLFATGYQRIGYHRPRGLANQTLSARRARGGRFRRGGVPFDDQAAARRLSNPLAVKSKLVILNYIQIRPTWRRKVGNVIAAQISEILPATMYPARSWTRSHVT